MAYDSLRRVLKVQPPRRLSDAPSDALETMRPFASGTGGDEFDPVALASLRDQRMGELEDRIAAESGVEPPRISVDRRTGIPQVESIDQRTPADIVRKSLLLRGLQRDQAEDPYTGNAEHARVTGIQNKLDEATSFNRPELADLRAQQGAEDIQHAAGRAGAITGATEEAKYKAAVGPEAELGANRALERKIREIQTPRPVPGQGYGGVGSTGDEGESGGALALPPNMKPLDQQSQRSITSLREAAPLVGELEQILQKPSTTGNAITNRLAYGLYHMGISPDAISRFVPGIDENTQKRLQVAGLLRVIASTPYSTGSRNFQFIKQAQEHLTNPGASDDFLRSQVAEIKQLFPRLQQEIITAHVHPGAALNFTPAGGTVIRDPNWGR